MSWRTELDAILPPDRADAAPVTEHVRGLLVALRRTNAEPPRIIITLDEEAWSALELQFRRPGRPHASYRLLALPEGCVAFERRKDESAPRCGVRTFGGEVCALPAGHQPGVDHGSAAAAERLGPTPEQLAEGFVRMTCRHCGVTTSGHRVAWCLACGKGYGESPATTAPSDAPWPDGPFPRIPAIERNEPPSWNIRMSGLTPDPPEATTRNPSWDATAIEAKAAALASTSDAPRSSDAIYSAPMTGAEATYGGPWKESK